ncbi:hypothetical protein MICRO11B_100011 [Micrococcus luteus]|nr:hypothetical protein MICRO11B_100011 [Micrococcus luteus]
MPLEPRRRGVGAAVRIGVGGRLHDLHTAPGPGRDDLRALVSREAAHRHGIETGADAQRGGLAHGFVLPLGAGHGSPFPSRGCPVSVLSAVWAAMAPPHRLARVFARASLYSTQVLGR